tara:strand:- start:2726 stop:3418 length:693 start_codon:yes stop_codon:yes gene_type:complete
MLKIKSKKLSGKISDNRLAFGAAALGLGAGVLAFCTNAGVFSTVTANVIAATIVGIGTVAGAGLGAVALGAGAAIIVSNISGKKNEGFAGLTMGWAAGVIGAAAGAILGAPTGFIASDNLMEDNFTQTATQVSILETTAFYQPARLQVVAQEQEENTDPNTQEPNLQEPEEEDKFSWAKPPIGAVGIHAVYTYWLDSRFEQPKILHADYDGTDPLIDYKRNPLNAPKLIA